MNKNHPTNAGRVLKQLMFKHDINESQLSHITGVSKSNISRLKNDPQCNPTMNTLIPIAKHFEITVSELIGEECKCNEYHQKPEIALTDNQFFEIFTKKYIEWIQDKSTSPHWP